jgi:hypothetical protein
VRAAAHAPSFRDRAVFVTIVELACSELEQNASCQMNMRRRPVAAMTTTSRIRLSNPMSPRPSQKSQSDLLDLVKKSGWKEDQNMVRASLVRPEDAGTHLSLFARCSDLIRGRHHHPPHIHNLYPKSGRASVMAAESRSCPGKSSAADAAGSGVPV